MQPPQDIRVIGLDMDDTTLNTKKQLTPRVRDAIAQALAAGITVLAATGRALDSLPPEVLGIPGMRYALCANGAMVYDLASGQAIYEDCFADADADTLFAMCENDAEVLPSIFMGPSVYSAAVDYARVAALGGADLANYLRASRKGATNLRQLLAQRPGPVEKFSVIYLNMEKRAAARKAFLATGLCSVTSSLKINLELNTPTANKGAALLALAAQLGVAPAQVMAVGDSTNDLEMLRAVGYAVAMGNAHPKVLAAAHHVTASADEDGVALAIEAVLRQKGTP